SRGSYYCFGCNAKGDIFSFVEQFEGLDFVGALKVLAQRAGVELVRENPKAKSEKDRLYAVLEVATEFFEKSLTADTEAKDYIAKRGVKEETVKNWRLGFAPDSWRALYDELVKKGFSPDEMIKAGLVKKSDKAGGGFYDMFRGRVMFPIFDSSERVIGFSARILPRLDDGKTGKYINSPETLLFNKSRVLYGLNKAKFDIRKRDYSIMVEGQMDLVMSHQAGFTNTVAVSGTALSSDTVSDGSVTNLGLAQRLSNNIILAFDSDEAGFKASGRNAKIALSLGMDVKVAKMPKDDDPADIILRDSEEWKMIIKNSKHVIDFSLETLLEKNLEPRKLGKEIQALILPYIKVLKSAIDQSHFVTKVSKATAIKEEALWTELKKVAMPETSAASVEQPAVGKTSNTDLNRRSAILKKLLGIILWQEGEAKPAIDPKALRTNLQDILGSERFNELFASTLPTKNDIVFEAEMSFQHASNLEREIAELLINLEIETIEEKLSDTIKRVKAGEGNSEDTILIHKLSVRREELKNRRKA
ncbi:MAG: DNA primase, partial [bacterium]|nr:DNA primase [bacterium]